ncbi:hypothetical protein [Prescottella subtropica]|uniref:hypothetical protein n=1 Tax=Prescottella subtropica TaxID=2545757 RepID=UPI0010F7C67A|nr:hypothetical protein [Prescottella subtropica]
MDLQSLPHLSWTEFTRTVLPALKAVPRDDSPQYALCPYDTMETFNRRVVVVTDQVTGPTVIRAPRRRSNRRPAALAVPHLDALTLPLAQALTRVGTDYIVIRHLFTNTVVRTSLVAEPVAAQAA